MVQSLQLGGLDPKQKSKKRDVKRLNRLPILIAIVVVILFFAVIFYGLSSRGLIFRKGTGIETSGGAPASNFADQLTKGVSDGVIGGPDDHPIFLSKPTVVKYAPPKNPFSPDPVQPATAPAAAAKQTSQLEPEAEWRARLERDEKEQIFRERQRQRMARLQAQETALDAPIGINPQKLDKVGQTDQHTAGSVPGQGMQSSSENPSDLYSAALKAELAGQNSDPNGQAGKEKFYNSDLAKLGYRPNRLVAQQSSFELKRGSVIPATLITGINSDLPGRIIAQVSQNVYDSATGHYLLIPQGTKLMGRYDSKVSFGQKRVLVVWTDIIFPNGATLQIGGMAGTDGEGYGGFKDQVNNHYFKTFGSAALLALIGTGIDMAIPENSTLANQKTASDAVRRNFAETFGEVAKHTIGKNLNVQPTLEIRPGYRFNVLVDQDIAFPGAYSELKPRGFEQ